MLKYVESAVVFSEFPDQIALALNLSLCPNKCEHCSESYLAGDIGEILDEQLLDKLISLHPGISLVGFMGGDNDHKSVIELTNYIHNKYKLKVGMYSGRDFVDLELAQVLDFYKIGRWIQPEGDPKDWPKKTCGPLQFPYSNQIMFERINGNLVDITYKFRKDPINNPENFVIIN